MQHSSFDSNKLAVELQKLSAEKQIVFGALCCERMFLNAQVFAQESGWEGLKNLRIALDLIWDLLKSADVTELEIRRNIRQCENSAPSSEDFDSLYVTATQDASFAICAILDFLLNPDVIFIVRAATYATDSVDLFVQEIEAMDPGDPNLEQRILLHPLMQRELREQSNSIEKIAEASIDDKEVFFEALRSSLMGSLDLTIDDAH